MALVLRGHHFPFIPAMHCRVHVVAHLAERPLSEFHFMHHPMVALIEGCLHALSQQMEGHFQKVLEAFKGEVQFFGLDVGWLTGFGFSDDSKRELQRLGITYPAGPVPDIDTIRRLEVLSLPSTDFITPDGVVQRNWTGILNESKLTELVQELINIS